VVPALLAAKIRVLVYAGEMDYICNYMGNKVYYPIPNLIPKP
jgi:hypothetical protein